MNLYFEMQKNPTFSMADVACHYDKAEAARSAVKRLVHNGLAVKIRNNLYTCISGETRTPLANRYQIASAITPSSYISHHTAMEYHGVSNQVFYEVYVSSVTEFRNFEFDGYSYRCIMSKLNSGIDAVKLSGGIRVTDKERTVIDSIKDMDKIAGLEEVIENIGNMIRLNEGKLLKYLSDYGNQFLYQKTGFVLEAFQDKFRLSEEFYRICIDNIGSSKRYLTKEIMDGIYLDKWKMIIPSQLKP
jgi:predicted transcriptional regulator of viral defense system